VSNLSEFKSYIAARIEQNGHELSPWYWEGSRYSMPVHTAHCRQCEATFLLSYDHEQSLWVCDGPLLLECSP